MAKRGGKRQVTGIAGTARIKCYRCRHDTAKVYVQKFKGDTEHFRAECGKCGKYLRFVTRGEVTFAPARDVKPPAPERQHRNQTTGSRPAVEVPKSAPGRAYDPNAIHSWHYVAPDTKPGQGACREFIDYFDALKRHSMRTTCNSNNERNDR